MLRGDFFVELRTKAFELENDVMDDNANKIPNIINGTRSAFSIEKSRRRIFNIIANIGWQINNERKEPNINPFRLRKEKARIMDSFRKLLQRWQRTNNLLLCCS